MCESLLLKVLWDLVWSAAKGAEVVGLPGCGGKRINESEWRPVDTLALLLLPDAFSPPGPRACGGGSVVRPAEGRRWEAGGRAVVDGSSPATPYGSDLRIR